jgi:hypothetical protein
LFLLIGDPFVLVSDLSEVEVVQRFIAAVQVGGHHVSVGMPVFIFCRLISLMLAIRWQRRDAAGADAASKLIKWQSASDWERCCK